MQSDEPDKVSDQGQDPPKPSKFSQVRTFSHFLDIHTTLRGCDYDRFGSGPVHQYRKIIFLFDIGGFREIYRTDLLTILSGLLSNKTLPSIACTAFSLATAPSETT